MISQKKISILFSNIRSLQKNGIELENILKNQFYDIIGLSETWSKNENPILKHPYYQKYYKQF